MTRPVLLAALGFAVLASAASPQQPPTKDDRKDPQAKFEPGSRPGEGQKFLEKFVGDWDVQKKFFRGGGEPSVTKGTCKQEMIHDGRFLRSEFTFDAPGGKSTGTGLIGFEPETGLFTSTWVDSRQTRMSFRQSEAKFDGTEIVLYGKGLGGREERRSRTVTRLEDGGK